MRFTLQRALTAAACAVGLLAITACAPKSYAVKAPTPSESRYEAVSAPVSTLSLVDSRGGALFSQGTLPVTLLLEGSPIDPMAFLERHLQAEFDARGLPVQVGKAADGYPQVDVRTFRMQNHRTNGYTPFITFTYISADVRTAAGSKRVGVFVKRGKVPVWSFDEIVQPTLNEPLSLAIKELASKLSRELYGARVSDAEVDRLLARLQTRNGASYLDAYALGFGNNAKAVPALVQMTRDEDEYVRIAAISSLGILQAQDQLPLLKSIYADAKLWQDRAMAIKAIGDLGTPEARAFLEEQAERWRSQEPGKESTWTSQVIALYL